MLAELIQLGDQQLECRVNDQAVAVVEYDWSRDGDTQPWQVKIGDKVYHTANTEMKCVAWVNWHLKNGVLPVVEAPVEIIAKACEENDVVAHDSKTATDVWVVTTVENKMIGIVGANSDGWWAMPSSSTTSIPLRHKSCQELISRLVIIEGVLAKPEMAPVKKEENMSLNISKSEMLVYRIVIDGAEENIIRETRNFKNDEEAVKYARDLSRNYLDAFEISVSRQVAPRRWTSVI